MSLAEDPIDAREKHAAYAGWPAPSSASLWHTAEAARLATWADQRCGGKATHFSVGYEDVPPIDKQRGQVCRPAVTDLDFDQCETDRQARR